MPQISTARTWGFCPSDELKKKITAFAKSENRKRANSIEVLVELGLEAHKKSKR